jgi:NAD(P)-dependent dehydrogenase (short-subunit alcohol dehydrogenase family)
MHVDLCSFESVRSFAKAVGQNHKKLDILINNAVSLSRFRVPETPRTACTIDNYLAAPLSRELAHAHRQVAVSCLFVLS